MEWTDEAIGRLRSLWTDGHSTAEIGRRLGVSKNAVVGKAHRLLLDPRPSPIRRAPAGEAPRRPAIRRAVGPTLPAMAHLAPAPAPERREPASPRPAPAAPYRAPEPLPAPVLRTVNRAPGGRLVACCWPIGEPGTRSFRFCDVESLPGKPYCSTHAALAYVRVRDRREDAA